MFTGILPVAKDENGLAAVLGHGEQDCIPGACISDSRIFVLRDRTRWYDKPLSDLFHSPSLP